MITDKKYNDVDDKDDDESTGSSSVDTAEAFMEMLGLSSTVFVDGISIADDDEKNDDDDDDNDCHHHTDKELNKELADKQPTSIIPENRNIVNQNNKSLNVGGGGNGDCVDEEEAVSSTTVTPLSVPHRCSRYHHHPNDTLAFAIDNFLTPTECQHIIQLADKLSNTGFHYVTEAAHTDNEGITHMVKLQEANKHKLSVFEHAHTSNQLWNKMEPIILRHLYSFMENVKCGVPCGLNPRLRVLRYDASDDDVFDPHFDATTKVNDTTSLLTVLIYLNAGGGMDFDGGETCFMDSRISKQGISNNDAVTANSMTKLAPATGRVVVFEHDLFHSSAPLLFGTKYVMRTDVLFEMKDAAQRQCDDNDGDDGGGGVAKPRGENIPKNKDPESQNEKSECNTLLEVCQQLSYISDKDQLALDGIGLLDLTLESLFAPGVSAARSMMRDVLEDEEIADRLLKAAIDCR